MRERQIEGAVVQGSGKDEKQLGGVVWGSGMGKKLLGFVKGVWDE